MTYIADALRNNPELAIFLTLAIGFLVGRVRFGTFKLGNVVGTLLAGVVVGQLDIRVDPVVKLVFFDLFLFATGYKVGPQFFRGPEEERPHTGFVDAGPLRHEPRDHRRRREDLQIRLRDGGRPDGRGLHGVDGDRDGGRDDQPTPPPGARAEAPSRPDSRGLCRQLPRRDRLRRLVPLGPRAEAPQGEPEGREPKKLEATLSGGPTREEGVQSAYREWDVTGVPIAREMGGKTVGEFEALLRACRVFVKRIRRGKEGERQKIFLEGDEGTLLASGDVVAIAARRPIHLSKKPILRRRGRGPRASRLPDRRRRRRRDEPRSV